MKKIVIMTGPGGAGKTTIAELMVKKYGYTLLDGDDEDTEFFPNGNQWLPENIDNLKKAHNKILNKTKELFAGGKKVIVDYIIFADYLEFLKNFKKKFADDLKIVVLFPNQEDLFKRDKERECWTSGKDRIKAVYAEFERIKDKIGDNNYINTSGLSVPLDYQWKKLLIKLFVYCNNKSKLILWIKIYLFQLKRNVSKYFNNLFCLVMWNTTV